MEAGSLKNEYKAWTIHLHLCIFHVVLQLLLLLAAVKKLKQLRNKYGRLWMDCMVSVQIGEGVYAKLGDWWWLLVFSEVCGCEEACNCSSKLMLDAGARMELPKCCIVGRSFGGLLCHVYPCSKLNWFCFAFLPTFLFLICFYCISIKVELFVGNCFLFIVFQCGFYVKEFVQTRGYE